MSYKEIPNILVDSVVLPHKPLSNLKIIDPAKKLTLYGFRGLILRDTLLKKAKWNECGNLNLDSYSGDGTHCVMWFKKVRISSISIVMECKLIVSWLHILSSQYFTMAKESNKTMRCFTVIYVSSHWSSFLSKIILKL